MTFGLDHLPARKRRQLDHVTQRIKAGFAASGDGHVVLLLFVL